MLPIELERPLAVFDIESTGVSPQSDRIIELAVVRLTPGGKSESKVWRVNPGMPIPCEATAIHGIGDADVADCPLFPDIADAAYAMLDGCDLAGYNVLRFDIPMLIEEFRRADVRFDVEGRRVVDAQRIFHRREPRDLAAALSFYCGLPHTHAHSAMDDVTATIQVMEGQFRRYGDLPRSVSALHEYCDPRKPFWADRAGRLKWMHGRVVLNFGRQKGTPLKDLVEHNPGFLQWILRSDFPRDTKDIVSAAMEGRYPEPPAAAPAAAGEEEAG